MKKKGEDKTYPSGQQQYKISECQAAAFSLPMYGAEVAETPILSGVSATSAPAYIKNDCIKDSVGIE